MLAGLTGMSAAGRAAAATAPAALAEPRGLDDERAAWLREWEKLPRWPIVESSDPMVAQLLEHARTARPLALFYSGGTHPGRMRRFVPDLLFRHPGCPWIYVSGFCLRQQAPRILRLDRIALA